MRARDKNELLMLRLQQRRIEVTLEQAQQLRRAEMTLRAWATKVCNGDAQRNEGEEMPPLYDRNGYKIRDMETPALKRVEAICDELGIYYYYQEDPRGAALWVMRKPLSEKNYYYGICCEV